jgi:predicted transcriptional regulator
MSVSKSSKKAGAGTVRISPLTHAALEELVRATGEAKVTLIERAVTRLREDQFWQQVDAAYGQEDVALREERALWDATLGDGMKAAK